MTIGYGDGAQLLPESQKKTQGVRDHLLAYLIVLNSCRSRRKKRRPFAFSAAFFFAVLNSCRSRRKKRSEPLESRRAGGCAQLLPESQKKTRQPGVDSATAVVCSTPAGVAEKNALNPAGRVFNLLCAQLLPESQKKTPLNPRVTPLRFGVLNSCRSRRKKRSNQELIAIRACLCSTPAGVAEKNADANQLKTFPSACAQLLPESQKKTHQPGMLLKASRRVLNSCRSRRKKREH